ncbi:MAG: hypothetical protein CME65_08895 [Halobacteriovoraceae bacterium]|nr:hypothetical protein [Halobacteriovoraceae bacterium]|tara:strand:- start:7892 stop:8584 length:693 start_codon:yes stop_codon:yes gene_type:complete
MKRVRIGLDILGFFLLAFNYLMILVFIFSKWPKYWEHINYEYSHLTWLSSLNLILISLFCFLAYILEATPVKKTKLLGWFQQNLLGFLSAGFLLLALDEKFQIHEKLRERIFIPNQVGTDIPGIGAGDFLHLFIAILGLSISYFIYQKFKGIRLSQYFFIGALLSGLGSVLMDVTSPVIRNDSELSPSELQASIDHQFIEELIEINAIIFFLMAFYLLFSFRLKNKSMES